MAGPQYPKKDGRQQANEDRRNNPHTRHLAQLQFKVKEQRLQNKLDAARMEGGLQAHMYKLSLKDMEKNARSKILL
tara:strand:- start:989 stop:1216 length:228 start_codon:yes stop_codon:yes gene_type:complete